MSLIEITMMNWGIVPRPPLPVVEKELPITKKCETVECMRDVRFKMQRFCHICSAERALERSRLQSIKVNARRRASRAKKT